MIIDGKKLALKHEEILKGKIKGLSRKPKIVSILIGDDPASLMYSKMKQKKAQELGIDFELECFEMTPPRWQAVTEEIKRLNDDKSVNGVMIQLPVPEEFLGEHQAEGLLDLIDPGKDVDGLNYTRKVLPCVPAVVKAILSILEDENVKVESKRIAVLGRSNLVGKPLVQELEKMGAKVVVGHSQTPDLKKITLGAEIVISVVGKPGLVTGEMISPGAVVIDAGAAKNEEGKIVGDIDFISVAPKASKITPVPGGVGPITIISLMENVVKLVNGNV